MFYHLGMKRFIPMLLSLTLVACAGAKLEKQKKEIEDLQTKAGSLFSQLKERADEVEALKTSKAELEGKITELGGRAAAAEGRAATLASSNKSLSDAIGTSKDELGEKINAIVAEKDDIAKKLSDAMKEKLSLERLKTVYQSAREKAGRELARLKEERATLMLKLAGVEAAVQKSDTDKKKAGEARSAALAKTREELGSVADALLKEMQAGEVLVEQEGESLLIVIDDALLFDEGSAKVTGSGAALLGRTGAALKMLSNKKFHVEAHSDNAPFKKGLLGGYGGHWELTAARATAAARWLHEHAGLDPARLSAAGFGEFRPAQPNDTPEGRAANRRVVIVVTPAVFTGF
jgi:chemotaxis protein MotB